MGLTLPGGFSPMNALRTYADKTNIWDGTDTDYDVFSDVTVKGGDRTTTDGSLVQYNPQTTAVAGRNTNTPNQQPANTGGQNESQAQLGGGGGSSAYTSPYGNASLAEDTQYLNDQEGLLRGMLSKYDTTLNQGKASIQDSYNKEATRANQQRSQAMEDFNVKREDTTRGKINAVGQANTNARTLADSVRRILGMASGSGSSAYQLTGPNAVARTASKNLSNINDTFGANFRDLATSEERATNQFEELLKTLEEQRKTKEQELIGGVNDSKTGILEKIAQVVGERARLGGGGYGAQRAAQAPVMANISALEADNASLFDRYRTPTFDVKPVTVDTPTLRDYAVDRAGIDAQTQGEDPYFNSFLRKRLEERLG